MLRVACALVTLACAVPCSAQWSVAAYLGAAHTASARLFVDQPAHATALVFDDVSFRGESLDPPPYYAGRVSRRLFGGPLWLEAELIHAKAYAQLDRGNRGHGVVAGQPVAEIPVRDVLHKFAMSHGLNFVFVNVAARSRVRHSRAFVAVRAGLGPTIPHGETEVVDGRREAYELGGMAFQVAGGVEIRLWRRLYWSGEYKLTHAQPTISLASGTASMAARSHHLAVGLMVMSGSRSRPATP